MKCFSGCIVAGLIAISFVTSKVRADTIDIDLSGFSAFGDYHGLGEGANSGVTVNIGAGSAITAVEFIDLEFESFGASWQSELVVSVNDDDGIPVGGEFKPFWDYGPSTINSPGTFGPASGSFGDDPEREIGEPFVASNGDLWVTVYDFFQDNANPDATISSGTLRIHFTSTAQPTVQGFVYHNSWSGGGSAVDSGKTLAVEGASPETLTFDNLINSAQGINGVLFEVSGFANPGALNAADFQFQESPQGAFVEASNPPANWVDASPPSSITVAGSSPSQVLIVWPNNEIQNRWLRITILATANTGLVSPETFYIGHLLGETTGPASGVYTISLSDVTEIRAAVGQTVSSDSVADIDKNGTVSLGDISAMRGNVGAQLTNITVP